MIWVELRPFILGLLIIAAIYFVYVKGRKIYRKEIMRDEVEEASDRINLVVDTAASLPKVDSDKIKKSVRKIKTFKKEGDL